MTVRGAFALALVTVAAPAIARPAAPAPAVAIDPARLAGLAEFVDGVVAEQIASREVAGAVVTVVHRGKAVLSRGYGFADVDRGIRVDAPTTLFRPGSVSKLFTYVALMQQIEAGRIGLDADVNTYLDFVIPPLEGKPIRVRDLMSHSGGFGGIVRPDTDVPAKLPYYAEWLRSNIPERLWAPGAEIAYSNYGVALAGYIVERVSGEPFADYADRHVFRPLGMTSTTFREPLPAALAPRMALGYTLADGRLAATSFEHFSWIMPAGSSTSSAPDMARFITALLNGGRLGNARILGPRSVTLLESDLLANAPHLEGMAHGLMVVREAGPRIVGHGGNTSDFHSYLLLAPAADFGMFLSFTGGIQSGTARTELTDAIVGRLFPQSPGERWRAAGAAPPLGVYRTNRRDYGRAGPLPPTDLNVAAAGLHAVTVTLGGRTTYWEQVGPRLYEQVTGARDGGPYDRIEFYGDAARPRLSFASQPHLTYRLVRP